MGSTETGLKRQGRKSIKLRIEEGINNKPSIKITVSSDAVVENHHSNNTSSSPGITNGGLDDNNDLSGGTESPSPKQKPALIQIVGDCCKACANNSGSGDGEEEEGGAIQSANGGVLCSCENEGEKRTRIALDDFTVLEFPNCIDFGIKDFLCCKDEVDLDISSDTDASFLEATPPHRFSDSELENQIEAMSITLDTTLNPFPRNSYVIRSSKCSIPDDDGEEEDEETTEESFIFDEDEGFSSSSASNNSAGTFCGASTQDELADLEHDNPLQVSSDVMGPQRELTLISPTASTNVLIQGNDGDGDHCHVPQETIGLVNEDKAHHISKMNNRREQSTNDEGNGTTNEVDEGSNREQSLEVEDNESASAFSANLISSPLTNQFQTQRQRQTPTLPRTVHRHPGRPFRRQVSLPASIFMSYLLEQNNKAKVCLQQNRENESNANHQPYENIRNEPRNQNRLNRSNSYTKRSANVISCGDINGTVVVKMRLPLHSPTNKICLRHQKTENAVFQQNSTEDTEEELQNSGCSSAGDYEENYDDGMMMMADDDKCENSSRWSSWDSKSDTNRRTPQDLDCGDEQQAFTSEVEKRSLILRHIRRLVRQDTTGNFAPPDFSI